MCDFRYAKLVYKYKLGLLYDEKIQWNKRLEMLKEINIIPSEILDMIILWSNKVKVNHSDYPFPTVYEFYNSGEYDLDEADCYEITKEKFEVEFKKAIEYCKEHNIKPYLLL